MLDHDGGHGFGQGATGPEPGFGLTTGPVCPFANYYQFYREVIFTIACSGRFVLLHDERNPAFLKSAPGLPPRGLWPILVESIPPALRDRVGRVNMQSVVDAIHESGRTVRRNYHARNA